MIVEQKKENRSSMKKPFVPQCKRRCHGRMGSICMFKGLGTFYLEIIQLILRTRLLSDPVRGNHYPGHGRFSLPTDNHSVIVIRQG
jgi:hypothetical protein